MEDSKYPPGWDEDRVRRVMDHYERRGEGEAVMWSGQSRTACADAYANAYRPDPQHPQP